MVLAAVVLVLTVLVLTVLVLVVAPWLVTVGAISVAALGGPRRAKSEDTEAQPNYPPLEPPRKTDCLTA